MLSPAFPAAGVSAAGAAPPNNATPPAAPPNNATPPAPLDAPPVPYGYRPRISCQGVCYWAVDFNCCPSVATALADPPVPFPSKDLSPPQNHGTIQAHATPRSPTPLPPFAYGCQWTLVSAPAQCGWGGADVLCMDGHVLRDVYGLCPAHFEPSRPGCHLQRSLSSQSTALPSARTPHPVLASLSRRIRSRSLSSGRSRSNGSGRQSQSMLAQHTQCTTTCNIQHALSLCSTADCSAQRVITDSRNTGTDDRNKGY